MGESQSCVAGSSCADILSAPYFLQPGEARLIRYTGRDKYIFFSRGAFHLTLFRRVYIFLIVIGAIA